MPPGCCCFPQARARGAQPRSMLLSCYAVFKVLAGSTRLEACARTQTPSPVVNLSNWRTPSPLLTKVVEVSGLEPLTSAVQRQRSTG